MFSIVAVDSGVGQVTDRHPGRVHDEDDDDKSFILL